jgi:hypothetical protein
VDAVVWDLLFTQKGASLPSQSTRQTWCQVKLLLIGGLAGLVIGALRYLNGRTLSPFPAEAGHVWLPAGFPQASKYASFAVFPSGPNFCSIAGMLMRLYPKT